MLNLNLTEEQKELLENNEWGIRGVNSEYTEMEDIDEEEYSSEWSDDPDYPGEEYDGVCAVEPLSEYDFGYTKTGEPATLEQRIEEAMEFHKSVYGYKHYYLVIGETRLGTEEREIVVEQPFVVAKIK